MSLCEFVALCETIQANNQLSLLMVDHELFMAQWASMTPLLMTCSVHVAL